MSKQLWNQNHNQDDEHIHHSLKFPSALLYSTLPHPSLSTFTCFLDIWISSPNMSPYQPLALFSVAVFVYL